MKAELRFQGNNLIIRVTDCLTGKTWDFGPLTNDEGQRLLRDYDALRSMIKAIEK